MFRTEKYNHSSLVHPFKKLPKSPPATAKPLEEALAARLESLLPIPGGSGEIPLAWLSLFVDVLSHTLLAATALISDYSLPISDGKALSSHLDGGIALLDACNAISAAVDRLRRRRLLIRLALHLLSSSAPEAEIRARDAIKEWDEEQDNESTKHDAADLIRKLRPSDPPRGKISAVRRAIYTLEALSALVATAVLVTIGGEGREEERNLNVIRVSGGDFSWAEAFNKVAAAVAGKLPARAVEVVAAEAAVGKLAAVLDGDGEGKEERLKAAVEEAEKATEELTDGLERLSDGVSGLFRCGLRTRTTALQGFRMTPKV